MYGLSVAHERASYGDVQTYSLANSHQPSQRSLCVVVLGRLEQEMRRVTEDAIVDIGVFNDGVSIVPFTVQNESNAQSSRDDEQLAERRDEACERSMCHGSAHGRRPVKDTAARRDAPSTCFPTWTDTSGVGVRRRSDCSNMP